jgi:colanic acid/amylovoran biosynthesis glycosyltransferase
MKTVVAHFRSCYLNNTETFIYEYISKFKKTKAIFLANRSINLDLFPFRELYVSDKYKNIFRNEFFFECILKKHKARLIHAHFGPEGYKMLGIKKKLKLPLITSFYGFDMSKLAHERIWRANYRLLFEEGDLFLVEGKHMQKKLIALGCPYKKTRVQHLGVDVKKFICRKRELKGKKIRILFCGRFVEKKGLTYALRAVASVFKKYPHIEFRIIGDGEMKSDIEELIDKLDMSGYVTLLGFQPNQVCAQEMQKTHILLQPSVVASNGDSEGGAPMVLLEAQASGVPVISTYHADIPEVVLEGEGGLLVPERDPGALVEKLKLLITNPRMRMQMGKAGRLHIEKNYNIYRQVEKIELLYGQLIANN